MSTKQELIQSIIQYAEPGNVDRRILETKTLADLEVILSAAWEHYKEEQILQARAEVAAAQTTAEMAKQEFLETRRPAYEAQQRAQLELDRKTFAAAAKQLRFSICDANFSLIRSTLGTGFTFQGISDSLRLGPGIELVRATQAELDTWEQERVEVRNQYLKNTDPQSLRAEAKTEAIQNRQTAQLTAFEAELIRSYEREVVNGQMPKLPQNWNDKRLDKDFIRRADKDTLRTIIKRFGSAQVTARLHGLTRVGQYSFE